MGINLKGHIYPQLDPHVGHHIAIAVYAGGENLAIECHTCGEVLIDSDRVQVTPNWTPHKDAHLFRELTPQEVSIFQQDAIDHYDKFTGILEANPFAWKLWHPIFVAAYFNHRADRGGI